MMLRANKYISKILDNSKVLMDKGLSYKQILWREENKNDEVLGIYTSTGLFLKKPVQLLLMKNSRGTYRILTVRSWRDGMVPMYIYDICDIEEFVKRYPIAPAYEGLDHDLMALLLEDIDSFRDNPSVGFIETIDGDETRVYEFV